MLEEIGGENGGGSAGQSTKSERAREEHLKAEVTPWCGGKYSTTRDLK